MDVHGGVRVRVPRQDLAMYLVFLVTTGRWGDDGGSSD